MGMDKFHKAWGYLMAAANELGIDPMDLWVSVPEETEDDILDAVSAEGLLFFRREDPSEHALYRPGYYGEGPALLSVERPGDE